LYERDDPAGAIALFRMNVELFPDSWNAYDSLAEAYMNAENNDQAILFYKKSLELNKNNSNADVMLKKLQPSE
jgi:Flp pilus assembly protein TadD